MAKLTPGQASSSRISPAARSPRFDGAVQVALEVGRRVLAREVAVACCSPSMPANCVYWPTFKYE